MNFSFFKYKFCFVLFLSFSECFVFSQGLKFRGNEVPIDRRTSFSPFSDKYIHFSQYIDIRFDVSILEPSAMGYIMRLKNKANNTTYNVLLERDERYATFKLNEEGNCNLLSIKVNSDEFKNVRWAKMEILFNLRGNEISFGINSKKYIVRDLNLPDKSNVSITFGKSDYIIDVPSFAIKDLIIRDNNTQFIYPLNENGGNAVHLKKGKKAFGYVSNPVWIINDAYYWKFRKEFRSLSVAGNNYNPLTEEIYYFTNRFIRTYNVRTGRSNFIKFRNECPVKLFMANNYVDYKHKALYVYEVYGCNGSPSVAKLDMNNYTWSVISRDTLPMQLHHHNLFFDTNKRSALLFGGFGNMRYNGNFYNFDLKRARWKKMNFKGVRIFPRYFSSMGYRGDLNTVYYFGGMGNVSGDQTIGRKYFYDLNELNLNTGKITKLWNLNWKGDDAVPVGEMIMMKNDFYTLLYPEYHSDSFLKLYRFSLFRGDYNIFGDSIPVVSNKIKTNVHLFFDSKLNELYAVTQEFDSNDTGSRLRIYSLSFPPVGKTALSIYENRGSRAFYYTMMIVILFLLIATAFAIYNKYREKISNTFRNQNGFLKNPLTSVTEQDDRSNSVFLFGDFTVRNKNNKDITYYFSSKLRQVFIVLIYYSQDGGIQSAKLSELLWPEKDRTKAKNSRGVIINHLRKILNEINGIDLVYNKEGLFRLSMGIDFYCDYARYVELSADPSGLNDADIEELLSILNRGKFLNLEDNSVFDSIKDSVEQKIIPFISVEMKKSYEAKLFTVTLSLAESMFNIDPVNEIAAYYMIHSLFRLKREDDATNKWLYFISEYEKIMGEKYPYSLSSFLSGKNISMFN